MMSLADTLEQWPVNRKLIPWWMFYYYDFDLSECRFIGPSVETELKPMLSLHRFTFNEDRWLHESPVVDIPSVGQYRWVAKLFDPAERPSDCCQIHMEVLSGRMFDSIEPEGDLRELSSEV